MFERNRHSGARRHLRRILEKAVIEPTVVPEVALSEPLVPDIDAAEEIAPEVANVIDLRAKLNERRQQRDNVARRTPFNDDFLPPVA